MGSASRFGPTQGVWQLIAKMQQIKEHLYDNVHMFSGLDFHNEMWEMHFRRWLLNTHIFILGQPNQLSCSPLEPSSTSNTTWWYNNDLLLLLSRWSLGARRQADLFYLHIRSITLIAHTCMYECKSRKSSTSVYVVQFLQLCEESMHYQSYVMCKVQHCVQFRTVTLHGSFTNAWCSTTSM